MNALHAATIALGLSSFGTIASASLAVPNDPHIITPCDDAHVDIYWVGSSTGFLGALNWLDGTNANAPLALFSNDSAIAGQHVSLPGIFALDQRLDFSYRITDGASDLFSTANETDWGQFIVDASNPLDVLVRIDDIREPNGDGDFNDATFRVVFSHSVPTPSSLALLGTGGLMMTRRRR